MELLLVGAVLAGLAWYVRCRVRKPTIWFDGAILRPDDLNTHAAELAKFHRTVDRRHSCALTLRRLRNNLQLITRVYAKTADDVRREREIAPAGDWLLDNYYIVEEQVKEILLNVGGHSFRELPVLKNGKYRGHPRIYAIVLELITHTDGRIDEQILVDFVNSYQGETHLTISEVWALALMVKIALVEKIRNSCLLLDTTHGLWRQAEDMVKSGQVAERIGEAKNLEPALVEHVLELMRRNDLDNAEAREVLSGRLADLGTSLEKHVQAAHQAEAARAASLGNAISSLKYTASLDWNEIFEALCPVDKVLKEDEVYGAMDFESRNYYRSKVQVMARRARVSETRVAQLAMEFAQSGKGPSAHCGYYLLDQGRVSLLERLGVGGSGIGFASSHYILVVLALTLAGTGGLALYVSGGAVLVMATTVLALVPVSDLAVSLVNTVLTRLKKPAFLPKLEYREGIPQEAATMVVVPALLTDADRAKELVQRLEVHYLANPEPNLYFTLLGDYRDSDSRDEAGDGTIAAAASEGIHALNQKYGQGKFFALIRRRSFSKTQNRWIGWERKRGALVEFNALLAGVRTTNFRNIPDLPRVQYVLTLDADTRLPMNMAKKLVGTISHPLNRPELDSQVGVVRGYGIIQPRIGVSLESANMSSFARVLAGPGGIDTYTTATSDVYQDWFGQGIFTGKGIYDLRAAGRLLADIPENSVLSHDLLEGGLMHTGLATDLELIDDFPAKYSSYSQRQHRWTRGDWQLIGWLWRPSSLSILSRWQIFDNLRRSLVPRCLLILLAAGLIILPGSPVFWVLIFLALLLLPHLFSLLNLSWTAYLRGLISASKLPPLTGLGLAAGQAGLRLAFLPHQAWVNCDAILRTLYRVIISRKNLLEWTTAAEAEKKSAEDYLRRFLPSLIVVLGLGVLIGLYRPFSLAAYLPFLLIWLYAPALARRLSRRQEYGPKRPNAEERRLLRKLARKTWYYYQDFVGLGTSHLPPDNFQVDPPNGIDARTSPTNIGFYLLAVLGARDLGFVPTLEMVRRVEQTLNSVEKLRKWKGHLFNWYHTRDLELLRPWFVSTVDSGNFVCMLAALAQGLREYLERPLLDGNLAQGLVDTLELELISPAKEVTIAQWTELVASLKAKEQGPRGEQLLLWLQEELDSLFPHTEIFNSPPAFLKRPAFSGLADLVHTAQKDPSARNLAEVYRKMLAEIDNCVPGAGQEERDYLLVLKDDILRTSQAATCLVSRIEALVGRIEDITAKTDFSALYNGKRHLFSIGYSVDEEKLLDSSYDLLASEARLTSFWAVISRQVPVKHWFKPGRAMTNIDGNRTLVSWAGTMFEYLMPPLLLKNYPNSLLAETTQTVIAAQRAYSGKRRLPWGVSESGYYAFDYRLNYQYRAFGIPDLGLKRGLVDDMVVSSYSTLLALPFAPKAALDNICALQAVGMEGEYGLYEAVDYTPSRVGSEGLGVVQSYMAHHQGMGFVALLNYLQDFAMVRRFHSDPRVQASEHLLQERIPLQPVLTKGIREPVLPLKRKLEKDVEVERSFGVPRTNPPNCHLLSNGSYSVLLTDSGSGYSKREDIQISRWREGTAGQPYGTFIFIRSLNNDRVWSATYAPLAHEPDFYRVRFSQDRASYFREARNIDTRTDVIVSSEDNAEIRQVVLTNHGTKTVSLEITSYTEIVLSHPWADLAHPAFNKLFIQTEHLPQHNAILASRRPRSEKESKIYALHLVTVDGEAVGNIQYETDRSKFLGRGRDISWPAALHQPLSNSLGPVLDPVFSLRRQIKLGPGETGTVTFITAQGTRMELLQLAEKYQDSGARSRAFDLAYTRSKVEARYLNMDAKVLRASQEALGHLLFPSPSRRSYADILAKNRLSQRGLWAQGISGDNPIVLVNIAKEGELGIVEEAIRAHEYWRFKGLTVDLVILNSEGGGYLEPVRELLRDLVQLSHVSSVLDRPGGIFIRSTSQLTEGERILLFAAARLVLQGGTLAEQLVTETSQEPEVHPLPDSTYTQSPLQLPKNLKFFNGYGGFNSAGEYVIMLKDRMTPAPWVNIIANPSFGCTVSERGAGFTFAENSRENKLTPWSNDPVADPPGEVIYLRDDESNAVWTVTAAPLRDQEPYLVTHGKGYSKFMHNSRGISQLLTVFVPRADSVKLSLLRLKNETENQRQLTLTYYIRPVLGVSDETSHLHIVTALDGNVFTIRNPYNGDFPGRVAWLSASLPIVSYTGDRAELLGRDGNLTLPAGLFKKNLSNRAGAGMDPCAAVQVSVSLGPGEEKEVLFQLGQAQDPEKATEVANKYTLKRAHAALRDVHQYWQKLTGTIVARTPEESLNLILGWLLYQALACRLWARSGFYQAGGAYGFRDQLQDAMNLVLIVPELTREQILLHAAHQFKEGDVQHWWHPGTNNRGVRTRFSDDLLWLPLAVAEYISVTGDMEILDEEVPFLEGKPLEEGEDERYSEAEVSAETASVYQHCLRALKRALRFGRHGIPLMGSGDWNDGMNTVGNQGQGESIWLGWFLTSILQKFAPLCRAKGDDALTEHLLKQAQDITDAIEGQGWDGRWYRRAYFDDGTPLGSAENPECSIDSIAQSWAVIAGTARRDRVEEAMAEVKSRLVRENEGLILLFTPPFDNSELKPGYIKGYVPGVRENGGQYTHASCWVVQAMAMLGHGNIALELFQLLNPINHSRTPIECSTYKTEPYALAADVYSVYPHIGRGGWTWYTGAAGWLYRVCIEYILGLRQQDKILVVNPCIPTSWKEFSLDYHYGETLYSIHVRNPQGVSSGVIGIQVDGQIVEAIILAADGKEHKVEIVMGI